jgi:hypothetical protein
MPVSAISRCSAPDLLGLLAKLKPALSEIELVAGVGYSSLVASIELRQALRSL